ncbi:hypothetical protein [Streptomyces sp. NRRL F-2890]|uniref:hypothetical protein n=1 Tax=Streptomyces sp. NRRL F-2890 TaxID=1463845 RepID=UPI0006941AB7|nr:hypothetical protein [Streptomyces sp. NRRL F-2890]
MFFERVFDEPELADDPDEFVDLVATTYPATATRTGSTWTVTIHDLPDGHAAIAQGTTWGEAQTNAHDIVVDLLGAHPAAVIVSVAPADPDAAAAIQALIDARIARAAAEQAERDAARTAARTLTGQGWSTRDAGTALQLSHQRISQLASRGDG